MMFCPKKGQNIALLPEAAPILTASEIGNETFRFLKRKIKKIYPAYLCSFLLSFLIRGYGGGQGAFAVATDILDSVWEIFMVKQIIPLGGAYVNDPTWYISAMLMGMLLLYPILLKFRETFFFVIAPAMVLFIAGWYSVERQGSLLSAQKWMHFFSTHTLRAFLGLSLGCICFWFCLSLPPFLQKKSRKLLCTCLEIGGYGFCFSLIAFRASSRFDLLALFLTGASVAFTFSRQTYSAGLFDRPICYFLGDFSLYLYLNHYAWLFFVERTFPGQSLHFRFCVFLLLSFACALLVKFGLEIAKRKACGHNL